MDELEEIRRRKLLEIQRQRELEELRKQEELRRQYEAQKQAIMRAILEPEARERLARLKLAHPDIAEAVETQLVYLAQAGRIQSKISDEMLVEILKRVQKKRETKIVRK